MYLSSWNVLTIAAVPVSRAHVSSRSTALPMSGVRYVPGEGEMRPGGTGGGARSCCVIS